MAEVTLNVAGRDYAIPCRDGEELHFKRLEALLVRHAATAARASGGISHDRTLVSLALILADLLDDAERSPPAGVSPVLLETLDDRLEAVAAALEEDVASA